MRPSLRTEEGRQPQAGTMPLQQHGDAGAFAVQPEAKVSDEGG